MRRIAALNSARSSAIVMVRELRIGHDRGGIRVHKNDVIALLFQGFHRLRPRVVEFRRLADDDRPGTEQQDAREISSFGHRGRLAGYRRGCGRVANRSPRAAWRHRPPGTAVPRAAPGWNRLRAWARCPTAAPAAYESRRE